MFRLLFLVAPAALAVMGTTASGEPEIGSRIDRAPGAVQSVESEDQATARRVMRTFAGCVVRSRQRWAEGALELPLQSPEQNRYVQSGLGGIENCMGYSGLELRFRPPSIVGGMAEELIAMRYRSANIAAIAQMTDENLEALGLVARNGNEDFALCVVRRDPSAVREFLATRPASPPEREQVGRIVPHLGACLYQGQTLDLSVRALRILLAPSLYRALVTVTAVPAAGN